MQKGVFLLFISSLFLFSCDMTKYDVILDNPVFDDLSVVIDEETYELGGYTDMELKLSEGTHTMTATNELGDVVFDGEFDVTDNGIVNPTGFSYAVWTDLYLLDQTMYDVYATTALNLESVVVLDGNEYNDIDLTVYEGDVFIAENWDFGLDEYWPDEVDIYSGSSYSVRSKVYRADQLEEDWGYYGDWDFSDYSDDEFDALLDSLEMMLDTMDLEDVVLEEE